MFGKWQKYSYAAQKQQRNRILMILFWLAGICFLYTIITAFFFSVWTIQTDSMNPSLESGDRLMVFPYKFYHLLPESAQSPFTRGQLVVVDTSFQEKNNIFLEVCDSVVRFVTAQKISILNRRDSIFMKRVIGLPGDEISMTEFVLKIKPADESFYFSEYELSSESSKIYETLPPKVSDLWDSSLPFSGNMDPILLAENEYFVLSDDRSNTNDSRTWGAVAADAIRGKAYFRFWPFNRFGRI
jgi:signal peptidase I